MKFKAPLVFAACMLLLTTLGCGLQSPPAVPSSVPSVPATEPPASPQAVATEAPTVEAPTATEEPTQPEPTFPAPASVAVPAAAPRLRSGAPIQVDEIHMVTATSGWGISGLYVLVTADGGRTWREVTPPVSFLDGTPDQAYGTFLDAQTAWVIFSGSDQIPHEAQVWHTTDGGNTWTPGAPLLHQVNAESVWAEFAVLDAQNVWLLVRGVYHGAGTHFTHELFHTSDGGLTWASLDGQISDDYTGMVFRDTLNGVRTLQTIGAYAAAPAAYDATSDGGATWNNIELPPPTDAPDLFNQYDYCETYQPDLFSTTFIRMLVGCFDYYTPPHKFVSYLYASYDDGKTWSTQLLPDKVVASQDTLIFFGAYQVLLLGRDSYQNTNGGFGDWSHVKTVTWDGQFSFVDAQHGWAVARSNGEVALVQTANGGGTWNVIKPAIK
jgi:photosystem II stability/assembly factor-like uncharacterized protein